MDELSKKIDELYDLLKALKTPSVGPQIPKLPTHKIPQTPSMIIPKGSEPKINAIAPDAKKSPRKIAEQIKNGSMSTKTQKIMLKANHNSQWSSEDLEKKDQDATQGLFHIHQGEHRITSEPLTVSQIIKRHGGVQHLENNGYRLHPVKPTLITQTPPIKKQN